MKRLRLAGAMLLVLAAPAAWAQTLYVSPDVPTDPDAVFLLPWDLIEHDPGAASPYTGVLTIPGNPAVNAAHRMDRADHWLFSVEAPNDLGGSLGGSFATERDVIRYSAGAYSFFFCGGSLPAVSQVPLGSSIDALYLDASTPTGGDGGDLIVSFDIPTTISAIGTVQPSALVRYAPTGAGGCADWTAVGVEIDFRTVAATYFPDHANVTGADRVGKDLYLFTLDIPTDLGPLVSGGPTFTPGEVVFYDPATGDFGLFDTLQTSGSVGWPISAHVDALTCAGNPGRIDPATAQITMDKVGAGDVLIDWSPGGCSAGAENYGIYEGELAVLRTGVYNHVQIDCDDAVPLLQEQVTPLAVDTYYLVVPYTTCGDEGSYGTDFIGGSNNERPQAASGSRCQEDQTLSFCP